MEDLIKIHEKFLTEILMVKGLKKNVAPTRLDTYISPSDLSLVYIQKHDFFKMLLKYFFLSLNTLYKINFYMDFQDHLNDFIVFLDKYGLSILEEQDEFPDDEELAIYPADLLDNYRKISLAIFTEKYIDINIFYRRYLQAVGIEVETDISSNKKFKKSVVENYKAIKKFELENKASGFLNLEHALFHLTYNGITISNQNDFDEQDDVNKKLLFLGKTFYESFSYHLPHSSMDSEYFVRLEQHLHVISLSLKNNNNFQKNTMTRLIGDLLRVNSFFDVEDRAKGRVFTNKHLYLLPEVRYIHTHLNEIVIELVSKTTDYDLSYFYEGIKDNLIRVDEFFLLQIYGIEIDRENNDDYIYHEYKRIFKNFYERIEVLKMITIYGIELWNEEINKTRGKNVSEEISHNIDKACLKQKEIINSISFDDQKKYNEILDLEMYKISLIKNTRLFEVEEEGLGGPTSFLSTLKLYKEVYYPGYYSFEITEEMLLRYNEILDLENKKILDKLVLELDSIQAKSGYGNEATYIEQAINKITSKYNQLLNNKIPIETQKSYLIELSEKSDYLRLYATSEFLYKIHVEDAISYEDMELTPIVTGLLKGTEQMLKRFIECYHENNLTINSAKILGNNATPYYVSESAWKEKLTINKLSQHIVQTILPNILTNNNLQHLIHKISRIFHNWNVEIRNSKFHHSNIYIYNTNLEYVFEESYNIVRIILQLMNLSQPK